MTLNPGNSAFPFQKLVTGRPLACSLLSKTFRRQVNLKHLEVTGFTVENRDKYITNFCGPDHKLKESIGNRIKETETINTMTFIPVFCWAMCSLFRGDKNIEAPQTHTALYAHLLLAFLLRKYNETDKKEVLKDPNIRKCLKLLSKMAYLSLKNGKIIFKKEDLEEWDIKDLEHTFHLSGLITKIEGGGYLDECSYQFTHLSLHEFLAAIYIFYNYNVPIDYMELLSHHYKFKYVVPYIAGLEGGRFNNSKSQKIVQLYSQLWERKEGTVDFSSLYDWELGQYVDNYEEPGYHGNLLLLPEVLYEYQNEFVEFEMCSCNVGFSGSSYHNKAVLCFLQEIFKWKQSWPINRLTFLSYEFSTKVSFEQLLIYMQRCPSVTIKYCCFQGNTWNKFTKETSEMRSVTVIVRSSQIDILKDLPSIYSSIIKARNKGNLKLRHFNLQIRDRNPPLWSFIGNNESTVINVELTLPTANMLTGLPFQLQTSFEVELTLINVNISVQVVKDLLPMIIPRHKIMYSCVSIRHCSFEEEALKELCDLFHNVLMFKIDFDSINQFNQCLVDFWINIVQQFESGTRVVPEIALKCINDGIISSFQWKNKWPNVAVKIITDKELDEEFRMLTKVIPYVKSLKCNLGSKSTWDGISKEIMKVYVSKQLVLSSLNFQGMFDVLSPEIVSCVPYLTIFDANLDLDLIRNISAALTEEENKLKIEDLHLRISEKQIRIRNHISDLLPCLPLLNNVSLNVKYEDASAQAHVKKDEDETCEHASAQANVKKNEDETCEHASTQANVKNNEDETCEHASAQVNVKKNEDETCEHASAQVNVKKNEDETCEHASAQVNVKKNEDETCEHASAQVNVKKNEDETCEQASAQVNVKKNEDEACEHASAQVNVKKNE